MGRIRTRRPCSHIAGGTSRLMKSSSDPAGPLVLDGTLVASHDSMLAHLVSHEVLLCIFWLAGRPKDEGVNRLGQAPSLPSVGASRPCGDARDHQASRLWPPKALHAERARQVVACSRTLAALYSF